MSSDIECFTVESRSGPLTFFMLATNRCEVFYRKEAAEAILKLFGHREMLPFSPLTKNRQIWSCVLKRMFALPDKQLMAHKERIINGCLSFFPTTVGILTFLHKKMVSQCPKTSRDFCCNIYCLKKSLLHPK